jgi:hypothetical protein
MLRSLLLPLLFATACSYGAAAPPPYRVCERMIECGGWGWEDQQTCEDELLDDSEYNDACVAPRAYRECLADCIDQPCSQFQDCELDCWQRSC